MSEHTEAEDDEQFCPDCFAGMESSEHFVKCERPVREALDQVAELLARWDRDTVILRKILGVVVDHPRVDAIALAHMLAADELRTALYGEAVESA